MFDYARCALFQWLVFKDHLPDQQISAGGPAKADDHMRPLAAAGKQTSPPFAQTTPRA